MHIGHRLLGNPTVTEGDMEYELHGLDCFPSALVQRPSHNFNATLDTPSHTGHCVLPHLGDRAVEKLKDTVSPHLPPTPQDHPMMTPPPTRQTAHSKFSVWGKTHWAGEEPKDHRPLGWQ